jgi:hypothetical protein
MKVTINSPSGFRIPRNILDFLSYKSYPVYGVRVAYVYITRKPEPGYLITSLLLETCPFSYIFSLLAQYPRTIPLTEGEY